MKGDLIYESNSTSIYKTLLPEYKEEVLVKLLKREYETDKKINQLENELNISNKITNGGFRKALKKTIIDGQNALILEFVKGQTLKKHFESKPMGNHEFLELSIKITHLLSQLHQQKIIHKDINSNNILYNPEEDNVHIIDFNISTEISLKSSHLENPDKLEGTLHYISPEQTGRVNRIVDSRSDLYSLGIVFYELLCGKLPFESQDSLELLHFHIAKKPERPDIVNPKIHKAIADIIMKLLSKNAEDRYQSASGLLNDLNSVQAVITNKHKLQDFEIGKSDFSNQFTIPEKLYGRDHEIKDLLAAFNRASLDQKELVLVSGISGTGKSALVSEVHKPITKKKGIFLSGKFDQFQRNNPYFAISQAFKSFCQSLLSLEEKELNIWRDKIKQSVGDSGEVLIEIIPSIELIIGKQPALPDLGASEAQNRLNFVFLNFIKTIAKEEHPMVLFIDDMQWTDAASLNLLYTILNDKEINHLLVILSYRDNEVQKAHPFYQMLEKLQKENLATNELHLSNLKENDINSLLEDSFLDKNEDIHQMAKLVKQKTEGNAFFVNQFLTRLYEENCIIADFENRRWVYDKELAQNISFSDNVVELMMQKVEKLPVNIKNLLEIASVIGNSFSLDELAALSEQTKEEIAPVLKEALKENLIIPTDDKFSLLESKQIKEDIVFKFVHDRIQQAFYEQLEKEETKILHLKIARIHKGEFEGQINSTGLFDMANHYNEAISLLEDEKEIIQLARFNAIAAEKAALSSANESALNYAKTGMQLLDSKNPEKYAQLNYRLNLIRAEAEHLCDNDKAAYSFYEKAVEIAPSKTERAVAYEKKIHFCTNIGSFKEAYATGREVLKKIFSINLPQNPPKPALIINMLKTKSKFKGQPVRDFVNHHEATAEDDIMAVKLMAAILKSAYQIKPELAVANAMVMVNLCMKRGNTADSAIGYLVFGGIFMGGILGMRETGQQFGQLAQDLNKKFNNATQKSEVLFVNGYFATSWLNPSKEAEAYFQKAYEVGLETGDLFHTGCSCCASLQHQLMRGEPLPIIEKNANAYLELLQKLSNNQETIGTVEAIKQAVACFQGKTDRTISFDGNGFLETEYAKKTKNYTSKHFAHYYFLNQLLNQYLNRDFDNTEATLAESRSLLDASAGMLHSTEHYFLSGIINSLMAANKKVSLGPLKTAISKFKKWSKNNPDNFLAKYLFLKAEYYAATHENWKASRFYTEALEKARKYNYKQLIPMAHERMAELFEKENRKEEANYHINRAVILYNKQGFTNKSESLSKKQQKSFGSTHTTFTSTSTTTSNQSDFTFEGSNAIDINTIIKSSQTLSGEVVLSHLLDKVMHLVIENAGAEKGFLLLKNEENQEWLMEAECNIESDEIQLLQHIPMKEMLPRGNRPEISAGIINFVMRTGDNVVLNDASKEGNFISDEHVLKTNPKSILCIPLKYKGKMLGILYLENNLAYGAFNEERIRILNMLTTQMAISIENAMLYENLEDKVQQRTAEVVKQKEIIEQKNENITASIKYAQRIQDAALPTNESISISLKENFILFKPRDIVSGDFYWYAKTEDKIFIAAVDCTGHGVPGAFMSLVGDSHLTQIVKQNNIHQPGKILDKLHEAIQRSLKQKETNNQDGMDAALCAIDMESNTLEFAGANNPLLIVNSKGELEIIKANKMAIGGKRKTKKDDRFTNHIINLEKGNTYYIYSDGYADQFGGPDDRKFMVKRMKELIQGIAHESMAKQKSILEKEFDSWKGDQSQVDDVLVIGFKVL